MPFVPQAISDLPRHELVVGSHAVHCVEQPAVRHPKPSWLTSTGSFTAPLVHAPTHDAKSASSVPTEPTFRTPTQSLTDQLIEICP